MTKCITPAQFAGLDAENPAFDSMDNLDYCGTARTELRAEVGAKLRGKVRTEVRGDAARPEIALLAILKFFVPGHLDGFEFAFVR
jgi:hypothetical protein